MNKEHEKLFKMVEVALYAALIMLGIAFIRIPMPTGSFVHLGNALVVLGLLLFGFKRGLLAASIGLFLFDVTHGYAAEAPITVLESVIVLVVIEFIYQNLFHRKDTTQNLIVMSVTAGAVKVAVIFLKRILLGLAGGSVFEAAVTVAITKAPASVLTAAVTAILIPLLYYPMKAVVRRFHTVGE